MILTEEQILAMFDECMIDDLSDRNWHYNLVDNMEVPEELNHFWTESGASKGVIGWDDQDWVIKIPFNSYDHGSYFESGWYEPDSNGGSERWVSGEYHEGEVEWFTGARNSEDGWDYCRTEVELYQAALEHGVDEFFAPAYFIGYMKCGHPVYVQQKIEETGWAYNPTPHSDEELEEASSLSDKVNWVELSISDIADIMVLKGKEIALALVEFIAAWGIGDLHERNLGRRDGHCVIIDYSSYHD